MSFGNYLLQWNGRKVKKVFARSVLGTRQASNKTTDEVRVSLGNNNENIPNDMLERKGSFRFKFE